MNRTARRILIYFIASAVGVAFLLLAINFFALAYFGGDQMSGYPNTPNRILKNLSGNLTVQDGVYTLLDEEQYFTDTGSWAILIDPSGNVIWQACRPDEIPMHYTINDIAQLSRWYLMDYPVYVQTREDGLLVLGMPKQSFNKYSIDLTDDWFRTLPQRILGFLGVNLLLSILLAAAVGMLFYRALRIFSSGVRDLRLQRPVRLKTKGIFRELSQSVNVTSEVLERKNLALKKRDEARSKWIAGISHDIRTPLAMIMGYSGELAADEGLSEENQKKAEIVTNQSIRIKTLIEDLNLISSLEYEMQPANRRPLRICALIRAVVSELMNNGLPAQFEIAMELTGEAAVIHGDDNLLKRAVYNLLNNSVLHNPDGCRIVVRQWMDKKKQHCGIELSDNGTGVEPAVLEQIGEIPKGAHGLGLPMAKKIIEVHGGKLSAENREGFCVTITLPTL